MLPDVQGVCRSDIDNELCSLFSFFSLSCSDACRAQEGLILSSSSVRCRCVCR